MPPMARPFGSHSLSDVDQRSTNLAWERHQEGRGHDGGAIRGVRSEIHRSWVRSTSAGIDPDHGEAPPAEDQGDLDRLLRANRELCRAARGSLDKIGRMLEGTEAMMILTDQAGLVIEAIGDPKTIAEGEKINLRVGRLWNEHAVGTNGIGTALWAGKPMFVHGSEHFVGSLKEWSCAAAPIRNPLDQSVMGAVDLSGLTKIFREHNAAFAAAAAGEIQAALAQAVNEERIRLLDALIEQVPLAGHEDGIVILDRKGRVLHRRGVERLILADGSELDARMGHRLVDLTDATSPEEIADRLAPTLPCRDVSSLRIDGEVRGVALVIDTKRERRHSSAPFVPLTVPCQATAGAIVAECPIMLEAIDLARRVARVDAAVLVEGETGTGKELFARLIHSEHSGRRKTPYVAINCGAFSRELFGAELFGHVEGAFTGATREGKAGKLEQAGGGVFCLDEIGEMPLEIQPYLLRVLEERVIYRIGDSRARPFDAHLVALTNRDLGADVEAGRFRRDLYYRINAVTVRVPPLRTRGEDILLLLDHFNRQIAGEFGLEPLRFSADLRDVFLGHRWPGNVRELRNLVQRLHTVSGRREVTMSDLPGEIGEGGPPGEERQDRGSLKTAERAIILQTVERLDGNLSRAAKALGITRPTLYRKLRLYNITRTYR